MTANYNIVCWKNKNGVYLSYYDFSANNSLPALTANNVIGKTDYDLYPGEIADIHYAQDQIVLQQACTLSYQILLPDNATPVQFNKQPLRAANGEIIGIIVNINNWIAI